MEKFINSKFVKFLVIGSISTLIDYCIYNFLSLKMHIIVSKLFSMACSSIFSYFMNKNWTFSYNSKTDIRLILKYYLVLGINIACNTMTNYLVFMKIHNKNLSFIAATIVAMCVNYALQHKVVFKKI